MKYTEKVPLSHGTGQSEESVDYLELLAADAKRERYIYRHSLTPSKFSVQQLLEGIEPPEMTEENKRDERYASHLNQTFHVSLQSGDAIAEGGSTVSSAVASSETKSNLESKNEIHIRIEINNDQKMELAGLAGQLRLINGKLKSVIPKVAKEFPDLADDLEKLSDAETKDKAVASGVLQRVQDFLEYAADENSSTGKALRGADRVWKGVQTIGKMYNGIAEWIGAMPQVPM